ncbi:hypothetical protein CARN8_3790002 [mine drainage metagenome]|uniref:Uncharacterized protein n=1 Tax=mine drainage metagenome TaxID=410659 RepID=A0A3P3ZPV0_9ZZZZ
MEMAKDSAQRQAQYRSKRPYAGVDGNGERRINTWVSTPGVPWHWHAWPGIRGRPSGRSSSD